MYYKEMLVLKQANKDKNKTTEAGWVFYDVQTLSLVDASFP